MKYPTYWFMNSTIFVWVSSFTAFLMAFQNIRVNNNIEAVKMIIFNMIVLV